MFVGFNLNLTEDEIKSVEFSEEDVLEIGLGYWGHQESKLKSSLKNYLNDGSIFASEVEKDWFPLINANVFISHSHKDLKLAGALARYLEFKCGIYSFIDSTVWGNANDLLKNIDDKYSRQSDGNYSYKKIQNSSSHVHMLLNAALMKMMDKVECVIFLNTPNSIVFRDDEDNYTESPWLYSELLMSKYLQKRQLSEYREQTFGSNYRFDSLSVKYKAVTDHLYDLNFTELVNLGKKEYKQAYKSLDCIYLDKGIIK